MPISRLLNTRTPRSAAFTTPISPGAIRTATPPMSAIVVLATVSADCAMNGLLEATFELSGLNRMPPNRLRMTQFSTLTARAPFTNTPVDPTLASSSYCNCAYFECGDMSDKFESLDANEKAALESMLYRCRALVGRIGEELRKKKPEHFGDESSLADLHASLEHAAWVLEQKTAKG